DVNDSGESGKKAGKQINGKEIAIDGDGGVARAGGRETDGVESASGNSPMNEQVKEQNGGGEYDGLRRNYTADVALSEEKKTGGEVRETAGGSGHTFGNAAKKGVCSERND